MLARCNNPAQRRPCTVLQPCRAPELVKVVSARDASNNHASSSSSASSSYQFFDRTLEVKCLADHCSAAPSSITVILGPRSAGKSALLTEFTRQRGLAKFGCFIDARVSPINNPSELPRLMAAYFAEQVFPGVEVNVSWKLEIPPFLVTTSGYMGMLDHWDKDRAAGALEDTRPPAFVLDEADVLME